MSAIFIKFSFFHQMIALQKLWKMLFISSKKLFSFPRYSNFCISVLPFSACWPLKINLKVYDITNCLSKNSVTHFVWYLKKEKRYDIETLSINEVSDKQYFYRKTMQKMCSKSWSQTSIILENNPKQPLHARNPFKSKIFWERIIKKP